MLCGSHLGEQLGRFLKSETELLPKSGNNANVYQPMNR